MGKPASSLAPTGRFRQHPERTYFSTCHGTVEIEDQHRAEKRLVVSGYHTPNIIHAEMTEGKMMQKAEFIYESSMASSCGRWLTSPQDSMRQPRSSWQRILTDAL